MGKYKVHFSYRNENIYKTACGVPLVYYNPKVQDITCQNCKNSNIFKEIRITESGHEKIEFKDYFNQSCFIEKSPKEDHIYLGVNCGTKMLIEYEQVRDLIKYLQCWVDTENFIEKF